MDWERESKFQTATDNLQVGELSTARKPLEILRNTEALLRHPTVATLMPILPIKLSNKLQVASSVAEEYWQILSEIDLNAISDLELQTARIQVGLSFIGFSGLMTIVLLLYLNTLDPGLSPVAQIHKYWYQYIWFVCLGVAGMFMLGREAMRPAISTKK
jgi:hypothetical protein